VSAVKVVVRSVLVVAALATSGCIVEQAPAPSSSLGTVEIQWTINGRVDSNLCSQSSAATLAVDLYDSRGYAVGSYDASCGAFATSVGLYDGSYSADARLLDASGRARSTTVSIAPFWVRAGSTLVVPIDFPSSSFY